MVHLFLQLGLMNEKTLWLELHGVLSGCAPVSVCQVDSLNGGVVGVQAKHGPCELVAMRTI